MSRQIVPKWIRDILPKKCCNCGSTENLQYHHIVPWSCGGRDIPSNVAVVCSTCHSLIHYGESGVMAHNDLIRDGIARVKSEGKHVGRKPADYERIMHLIARYSTQFNDINDEGYVPYTEHEIMEMAGVKEVCYFKCKQMLKEAIADEWKYAWPKPKEYKRSPLYDRYIKRLRREGKISTPLEFKVTYGDSREQ